MIQDKTLAMSSENKENNKENTMENGNNKRAQQMSNDECESIFGKSPESDILGIQDTLVTHQLFLQHRSIFLQHR